MSNSKILYICPEVTPYLNEETLISNICRYLPQAVQESGHEVRVFMPKYGCINERRNQLHEVIRLSGMNLIINDTDHQLIIKVASIAGARLQIYFIDSEDFFSRKAVLHDDQGQLFADNDERAMFFARGVMETVKKLRWSPDIVHCHGWFSGFMPAYLKRIFKDDPIFAQAKVVMSLYEDKFDIKLDSRVGEKLKQEGVKAAELEMLQDPDYLNYYKFALQYADGVVKAQPGIDDQLWKYVKSTGLPTMECYETENFTSAYSDFYESINPKK